MTLNGNMKITLFGGSSQGKTCYTLALLALMANGVDADGFRIEAKDADTFTKYIQPWERFVLEKEWPEPTQGRTPDTFKLFYEDEFVTEFDWVDYRGGAIKDFAEQSEDVAQLHADIQESNGVLMVADAYTIATKSQIEADALTSSQSIFDMLNRFKFSAESDSDSVRGLTMALVLSKADVIPEEYKDNDYEKLITKSRSVFRGVVNFVRKERAKTSNFRAFFYPSGMIPISVMGDKNAEVGVEGVGFNSATMRIINPPMPMNIYYPFLFCIGNELDRLAYKLEETQYDFERRITRLSENVVVRILRGRTIASLYRQHTETLERLKEIEPKIRIATTIANRKMRSLIP